MLTFAGGLLGRGLRPLALFLRRPTRTPHEPEAAHPVRLKWNPFTPEVPVEALHVSARLESFCWRIEHAQVREGGFALIHGEPGSGKSVALRVLAQRLARLPDVQLATISHPQSNLADFYQELGDVFAVPRAMK